MRPIAPLSLALLLAAVLAPEASAHGGGFGHGGRSRYQAPSIACDCGKVDCPKCSAAGLAAGEGLSKRETRTEVVRTWGELAEVRVTTVFEAEADKGFLEAFARVERPPLLAVTGGGVTCVEEDVTGTLTPSQGARRDYLWERNRRLRDPMLVLRENAGAVTLRVFPISARGTTTATLRGYTLLAAPDSLRPRLYRTEDRFLVVLPRTEVSERDADFVDEAGARVLLLLPKTACCVRYPALMKEAVEVPCVPALSSAIRGKGTGAVNDATALVALPAGSRAPSALFVGPAQDAPWFDPGVPPGLRAPGDPSPPPPPPPPADPKAAAP